MKSLTNNNSIQISTKLVQLVTSSLYIVTGILLFFASSQIRIESYPVPFTLQTFAVIAIGLLYPYKLGIYTILCTYLLTSLGLPLCAGYASGVAPFFGPGSGYLLGFYSCVWFLHMVEPLRRQQAHSVWLLQVLCAQLIIWLSGYFGLLNFMDTTQAFWQGVFPFMITDMIKAIAAVFVVRALLIR